MNVVRLGSAGRVPSVRLLSAPTAEEGIELAEAFVPDVILLDINLPGMDGFAALAQLRGIAALRTTPVLAVSASAMPDDVERGRVAGFSDYLVKPVAVPLRRLPLPCACSTAAADH